MDSFPAGIEKGTNRFVSSSKSSWRHINTSNFFRIKNDHNFYEIVKVSEFCYNQEFETVDLNTIRIRSDVGANLLLGDELKLMYSIFSFVTVFSISNPGVGYRVNDLIKLNIKNEIYDTYSGEEEYTSLKVTEVDERGQIIKFSIAKKGSYYNSPPEDCDVVGGHGEKARFKCFFKETISSQILDREIVYIDRNIPTVIQLNCEIPPGITKGNLSVDKWELFITANHEKSIYDVQYEVIKDFTPYYRMPLLLPNSFSREMIYNRSISIMDSEMRKLENRISELEKRLANSSNILQ